ncbi:MAG: antibiotic biosynthesis monooxygenase family protein [Candidatus Hydrothermarchaeota archaeon]
MHARVVTVQIQPGKMEETISLYRDSVVPAAKQQQGFKGALLLTDSNTGKALSIVLWETEADMKVTEASGYFQEQIAKFAALFAAPPVTEHYEVRVQV